MSYVPLLWIMAGAEKAGVRFLGPIHDEYRRLSDENGPVNDSRAGIGGYYRYNPRRIERLAKAPDAGVKIERAKVSESVFRRIKIGQDGYAPIVIPPEFDVVRIDGGIEPGERYMNAGRKPGEPAFSPDAYAAEREHVFNIVWWRRIAYFVTLGATLLLAATPLRWPALPDGACHSEWCFLSDIIGSVSAVVPGFLSAWTDAFSSRPDVFGIIALLIVAGLIAGGMLEVRSRDAMRVIWYSDPATTPPPAGSFPAPVRPGPIGRAIERLRRSRGYVATFRFLTQKALPFMFLLAVFYGAGAVLAQSIFAVRSSWGSICRPTIKPEEVEARRPVKERAPTDALCAATGLELKESGTYRLIPSGADHDP